jgi:RNA polymerase sigma-70 factor, ECF subfamily
VDRQHLDPPPGDAGPPPWESLYAERARAGDESAFARLVDAYAGRIHAHVWRFVRCREDADDLTQETFLRAYRALSRFDPGRPFGTWLYTIATNVSLNALRTRGRRLRPVSLDARDDDGPPSNEPRSALPDGREAAHRAEQQAMIAAAVDQLDAKSAALVRLYYQEEIPLREAGEIMGLSESAAKVALHRARKRLRLILTGEETS